MSDVPKREHCGHFLWDFALFLEFSRANLEIIKICIFGCLFGERFYSTIFFTLTNDQIDHFATFPNINYSYFLRCSLNSSISFQFFSFADSFYDSVLFFCYKCAVFELCITLNNRCLRLHTCIFLGLLQSLLWFCRKGLIIDSIICVILCSHRKCSENRIFIPIYRMLSFRCILPFSIVFYIYH